MSPGLVTLFFGVAAGHPAHHHRPVPAGADRGLWRVDSQSGAVGPFPQAAGAASALNGFVMMLAAFAMGGWLGRHMDGTLFPLAYGLWFWSVLIAASAWTLVQKYGEPARH